MALARREADVVALHGGGDRQHYVGALRRRRPELLVHHDRVRLAPGALEFVQVLVVVIRVAAGPVDQMDVGRSEEHTSELQSLMRISYAVFCLKKKTIKYKNTYEDTINITTHK